MPGSRGVSTARPARGENRFYVSPAMRRNKQLLQQKPASCSETLKRTVDSDRCGSSSSASSHCSVSGRVGRECSNTCSSPSTTTTTTVTATSTSITATSANSTNRTNLDRFLDYTAPIVPAQFLPKTSIRGWRNHEAKDSQLRHPFFVLGDLWESFKEWSAYGAGVPVLLNGNETVVQYYVPYLSGIQLYVDSSMPSPRLRRPGEESDADSSRETSSDGGSDYGSEMGAHNVAQGPWNQQNITDARIRAFSKPIPRNGRDSSSDECEVSNMQGELVFEYLENASPFTREPLADKISILASQFPELKTYRSCDLSHLSWISVAWYPIYRIPMGPTLQNLDACFLTFHYLSTPLQGQKAHGIHIHGSGVRDVCCCDLSTKLHLPTFGLASYKLKVSFWNPGGDDDCQKVDKLLQAADNWLRDLQVYHPDHRFFISHSSNQR